MNQIVIVGASLAGLRAAETLRSEGFGGTMHIVGDEPHLPYDRPPLSKQLLAGAWNTERVMLMSGDDALGALDAQWHLGVAAKSLDIGDQAVEFADGNRLDFDGLIIATGARARQLRGTEGLGGVYTLRTLDDALALQRELREGTKRVVVVGAGFIGAEVAATARGLGHDVTMVEVEPVPLARILGAQMGQLIVDVHRSHGVDMRLGVGVEALVGEGRVESVVLSDGTRLDADVVVVGIGVIPNTEWLEGSGLTLDDGVVCDETCLAAPGVVAAGDVARWTNRRFGESMRVEHWDNAVEQGVHAARRLLAAEAEAEPYEPIPWFWTDQYDLKLQLAGRSSGTDRVEIVAGSVEERRFAAIYCRGDDLVGVLGVNRPRHVMQYRQLIADGASAQDALDFAASSS